MSSSRGCSSVGSIMGHNHAGVYYPKPFKLAQNGGFHKVQLVNYTPHPSLKRTLGFSSLEHSYSSRGSSMEGVCYAYNHDGVGCRSERKNNGLLNCKETMLHLNNRLESYLMKVQSLEKHNAQLEKNIQVFCEKKKLDAVPDYSKYFRAVDELQSQISSANDDISKIVLQTDNTYLTAQDWKSKYEEEIEMRNSAEVDVCKMQNILGEIKKDNHDLDVYAQSLQEEITQIKINHEEEVTSLRGQLGTRISVVVDAAPSVDLNQILSEIREQYEILLEKNMKEAEDMFTSVSLELNNRLSSGADDLQEFQKEAIDLKHCVQTLEIELQTQLLMKSALEHSLEETCECFASQLSQIQNVINNTESHLSHILSHMRNQDHTHKSLIDQKTYMDMEINTYKRLIEQPDMTVHANTPDNTERNEGAQQNKP